MTAFSSPAFSPLALPAGAVPGAARAAFAPDVSAAAPGAADLPRFESRDQIDPLLTWDLSGMFASDQDFARGLEAARGLPERYRAFQGTACKDADGLLAFLLFDEQTDVLLSRLANYAERRHDEDTRDAAHQDASSQVTALLVNMRSAASWFVPALLAVEQDRLDGWYADQPQLEDFRRAIEKTRRMRPYTLPAEQEALLAEAGEMAAQPELVFSMLNDADLTFPDATDSAGAAHPVTHGTYVPLMTSPDRELRRSAFESLYGTYRQFRNTSAALLGAQERALKFFAQAHRYQNRPGVPASMAAALDATEVPQEVYLNLIESVHRNMGHMYRYVDLRRAVLGVEELHYWDVYAPLVDSVDLRFTYEQACDLVLKALEPMGREYLDVVRLGLSQRWVDVYETPGKRSGAYSAGGYGMHPVILLNFQGRLDDVFTLAHELGHSVHTYLSCLGQRPAYSDYEMFVAEVASTCNECLLTSYLLDHVDGLAAEQGTSPRAVRAYLVNHFLEQFRTTLFRQCMFAEFERDAAQMAARGQGMTADALCERYARLNAEYFGPGIAADPGITLEWARIPHFYYNYYVYVYATSFSAAVALSRRILDQGAPAVADYLGFLRSGSSKPPIDILRGAGVDMATPQPVDDALALFGQLVDQLAALLEADE